VSYNCISYTYIYRPSLNLQNVTSSWNLLKSRVKVLLAKDLYKSRGEVPSAQLLGLCLFLALPPPSHSNWNTCGSTCVKSASIMTYHVSYHRVKLAHCTVEHPKSNRLRAKRNWQSTGNLFTTALYIYTYIFMYIHIYIYIYIYMYVYII